MNNDSKRLLDEVIEETAPPEFRDALFSLTLRHVRRRRRVRTLRERACHDARSIGSRDLLESIVVDAWTRQA